MSPSSTRILLLGKNGQVGWELQRSLAPLGCLIALDRAGLKPGELAHLPAWQGQPLLDHPLCGDLSDLEGLRRTVHAVRPHVIVNAAAYTAVDKAESEVGLAHRLNAEAPGVLAQAAHEVGAWLVHYSTDYVFNGSGHTPWQEGDPTGPLNAYGLTKLEGEQRILQAGRQHLIFRTSWVYAARGGNFAKTMLRLARERERLTVIDDQFGAPTGAEVIADITAHAIRHVLRTGQGQGTYHLAASGETTWHGYARFVIEQAQRLQPHAPWKVQAIDPAPAQTFPTPARRPHNSRLNTTLLASTFGLHVPLWQEGVGRMLQEIL
ncbi:dTDP-4-dehydrorhamnose reductase [Ferrovum sp. JA12]|uniref:dTDP-4-dehydrorhamnose reductase n=1 Tax=Ferrovum sp. JA12 TaxID=1356299 RepID=UPI00070321A7|nr:dTDP-4-dehydrorhamnose reductase [Ferrovum sp. JA12]KRH79046.1 dTDP-4-dehydrorhamnose reductase [Ferrovum sp. JA12]